MFRTHSRSNPDFTAGAYEHLGADRHRKADPIANSGRAFIRAVATIMRHLLNAMHESRRKEAVAALKRYGHLIGSEPQLERRTAATSGCARESRSSSCRIDMSVGQGGGGERIRCAITGRACDGDRAYLCDEWGCARKGGLSPISHENF